MVELLAMLMHMLDLARHNAAASGGAQQLQQLVLVLADGRFHEKDSLRRMVMVRRCHHPPSLSPQHGCYSLLMYRRREKVQSSSTLFLDLQH